MKGEKKMKKLWIEYNVCVQVEVSDEAHDEIKDDPGTLDEHAPELDIKPSAGKVNSYEISYVENDETREPLYEA